MADYLGDLQKLAGSYLDQGGLQVFVKTNYGPEIPIYTGKDKNAGQGNPIAELIGLRAQVIVKDAKGKTVTTYGDAAPTDMARVLVVLSVLGLIGFVVVRGVIK